MPPYSFGDAHWVAAHVLCFAGAILGGVGAWAYAAAAAGGSEEGAHDWLVRAAAAAPSLMLHHCYFPDRV